MQGKCHSARRLRFSQAALCERFDPGRVFSDDSELRGRD